MKERMQLLMDAFFGICATLMVLGFAPVPSNITGSDCGSSSQQVCLEDWLGSTQFQLSVGAVCLVFFIITRFWYTYSKSSTVGRFSGATVLITLYVPVVLDRTSCLQA